MIVICELYTPRPNPTALSLLPYPLPPRHVALGKEVFDYQSNQSPKGKGRRFTVTTVGTRHFTPVTINKIKNLKDCLWKHKTQRLQTLRQMNLNKYVYTSQTILVLNFNQLHCTSCYFVVKLLDERK